MKRLLLTIFFYTCCAFTFAQSNYVVVANNIGSKKISNSRLSEIFKGKFSFWDNGKPVVLIIPGSKSTISETIAKNLYKFNSFDDVQKYWLSLVFQGRSKPPVFTDYDDEAIKYVLQNEGAITIISTTNRNTIPDHLIIEIY